MVSSIPTTAKEYSGVAADGGHLAMRMIQEDSTSAAASSRKLQQEKIHSKKLEETHSKLEETHPKLEETHPKPPKTQFEPQQEETRLFSSSSSSSSLTLSDTKIAFFDIGKDNTGELYTPDNINTGIFQVLYQSGARIFSNSWGSEENSYTDLSQQSDWFMWKYPDTLLLYANGNSGKSC
jgi:hypothetical protein